MRGLSMIGGVLLLFGGMIALALGVGSVTPRVWGHVVYAAQVVGDFDLHALDIDRRVSTRLTHERGVYEVQPAWSPDGKRLAYVSDSGGGPDIFVRRLFCDSLWAACDRQPTALAETRGSERDPAWSPDGHWIIYAADADGPSNDDSYTRLFRLPADCSTDQRDCASQRVTDLIAGSSEFQPTWSPDGERIAFVSDLDETANADLYIIPANCASLPEGCAPHVERVFAGLRTDLQPMWSPDGKRLLFTSGGHQSQMGVLDLESGSAMHLHSDFGSEESPIWSPDGDAVIYVYYINGQSDLYLLRLDCTGQAPACGMRLTSNRQMEISPHWRP